MQKKHPQIDINLIVTAKTGVESTIRKAIENMAPSRHVVIDQDAHFAKIGKYRPWSSTGHMLLRWQPNPTWHRMQPAHRETTPIVPL